MLGTPVYTRGMGDIVLQDGVYEKFTARQAAAVSDWLKSLKKSHRDTFNAFKSVKSSTQTIKLPSDPRLQGDSYFQARRETYEKSLDWSKKTLWQVMKASRDMNTAGVSSSIGFNFYDLRGPVELLFPFFTPFRNFTPREPRVNDGVGTAAHWQRITNPGYAYPGVPEAQRTQITTPNMVPAIATYKEFGKENQVTYTAEFAGEGFNDNLATERLDALLALFLSEEAQLLNGNAGNGTGANGFQLGTGPTPTTTLNTGTTSTLPSATSITVYCV